MLCVRAPVLEQRLAVLTLHTGKTKSHYIRLALQTLFDEIHLYEKQFSFEAVPPPSHLNYNSESDLSG